MLSRDEIIIFEKNIRDGINFEFKGNYKFALSRYNTAYEIAKDENEIGYMERAMERIKSCEKKLEDELSL